MYLSKLIMTRLLIRVRAGVHWWREPDYPGSATHRHDYRPKRCCETVPFNRRALQETPAFSFIVRALIEAHGVDGTQSRERDVPHRSRHAPLADSQHPGEQHRPAGSKDIR